MCNRWILSAIHCGAWSVVGVHPIIAVTLSRHEQNSRGPVAEYLALHGLGPFCSLRRFVLLSKIKIH